MGDGFARIDQEVDTELLGFLMELDVLDACDPALHAEAAGGMGGQHVGRI